MSSSNPNPAQAQAQTQPPTRTFHAKCHCSASTLSFTVPVSSLPLPVHFCHCNICRHTHGTLCSIHAPIPEPSVDFLSSSTSKSTFTAYASSSVTTRYFCTTCGAHMLDKAEKKKQEKREVGQNETTTTTEWFVAASLVDAEEEVWKFWGHIFVGDTWDGGLAGLLERINGREMKVFRENAVKGTERGDWVAPFSVKDTQKGRKEKSTGAEGKMKEAKLEAKCHCGGIRLLISPPRNDAAFKDMPENMLPRDKSKWYALHDACTSCRLLSGCAIVSWVFPERTHISLPDGSIYPEDGIFGTAKAYESSPGVRRTFCGTCGAVVSYTCADRPSMIDIGAGLLDLGDEGGQGLKGERWFEWRTHRVAYEEDAVWKGVLASLKEGLKKWDTAPATMTDIKSSI